MEVRPLRKREELEKYLDFAGDVYAGNPHWIPNDRQHQQSLMDGSAPQGGHCLIQPFWAEHDGRVLATATAVIDETFNGHWHQKAGHIVFFEALPEAREPAKVLLDGVCQWLAGNGAEFARLSFLYGWQLPLTIDSYDVPPTLFHTYNPPYYHGFIKDAGFVTECGQVEYRVRFDDRMAKLYAGMIAGVEVKLRPWNFDRLGEETETFTGIVNRNFAGHWGAPPFLTSELSGLTVGMKEFLVPELTVFAEVDGSVVGGVYAIPDLNQALRGQAMDHGVLLVIGVDEPYRGQGINLAMAARSFQAMMKLGYKSASYTSVLDDNWPSRRTAEKLGARVARNFTVYRREM